MAKGYTKGKGGGKGGGGGNVVTMAMTPSASAARQLASSLSAADNAISAVQEKIEALERERVRLSSVAPERSRELWDQIYDLRQNIEYVVRSRDYESATVGRIVLTGQPGRGMQTAANIAARQSARELRAIVNRLRNAAN